MLEDFASVDLLDDCGILKVAIVDATESRSRIALQRFAKRSGSFVFFASCTLSTGDGAVKVIADAREWPCR